MRISDWSSDVCSSDLGVWCGGFVGVTVIARRLRQTKESRTMPKKETPAKATTYAAPALEKGLDILELRSSVSRPMGLSDLSPAVGRSKNEIFRMLQVSGKRQ